MPPVLHQWISEYLYVAIFLATAVEGIGLPLPAEALFLAAAAPIAQGTASLQQVVLTAAAGNLTGAVIGFGLAYQGGPALMRRAARLMGVSRDGFTRVEGFFARYGAATIFLTRFVGVLRVPAVYVAGAGRMAPWRFAVYFFSASLIWNGLWAWLALHFGRRLPYLVHAVLANGAVWGVALMATVLLGRFLLLWYRRRSPIGS